MMIYWSKMVVYRFKMAVYQRFSFFMNFFKFFKFRTNIKNQWLTKIAPQRFR
jgi:hypothetical protein